MLRGFHGLTFLLYIIVVLSIKRQHNIPYNSRILFHGVAANHELTGCRHRLYRIRY